MNRKPFYAKSFRPNSENWQSYSAPDYFYSGRDDRSEEHEHFTGNFSQRPRSSNSRYYSDKDYEWKTEEFAHPTEEYQEINNLDLDHPRSRSVTASEDFDHYTPKRFFHRNRESNVTGTFSYKVGNFRKSRYGHFYAGDRYRNDRNNFEVYDERIARSKPKYNKLKITNADYRKFSSHDKDSDEKKISSSSPKAHNKTVKKDKVESSVPETNCIIEKNENILKEECDSSHILDSEHFITVDSIDEEKSPKNSCDENRKESSENISQPDKTTVDVGEIENLQNVLDELIATGNWDDDDDSNELKDIEGECNPEEKISSTVQGQQSLKKNIDKTSKGEPLSTSCDNHENEAVQDEKESSKIYQVNNHELQDLPLLIERTLMIKVRK